MFEPQPEDLEADIARARQRLAEFESAATTRDLMARLSASSPLHPFLLVRTFGVMGAVGMLGILALVVVGSILSRDVAESVNAIEGVTILPVPVVLLFLAFAMGAGAGLGWFGAVSAGRDAPYLPHESKVHQRLLSEVQQLEARRNVKERMTPKPATPRLLDRRTR